MNPMDPSKYNDPSLYGKDNGSKQRLRVRKACEICKKRKIKCDGHQPCTSCTKNSVQCVYKFTDTASPISKPKPGRSLDKESIANALLQLESSLLAKIDSKPTPTPTPTPPNLVHFSSSLPSPWQTFSLDKYRFHRRYQNLLPYYLGQSLMQSLPPQTIQHHNLKTPRVQNYGWNMSGGHYLKNGSDSSLDIINFDDPVQLDIVNKLLRFYFDHLNPVFSIVHEQVFLQQFNTGFLNKRQNSSKLFISMLYLILATSLRFYEGYSQSQPVAFSQHQLDWLFKINSSLEERLFHFAHEIVSRLSFEWESFELIQSWLLIAFYLRTCHRQTSCWNALGSAIRMCKGMALYLNRFPQRHTLYEETKVKNCFWSCFIMDKVISFQMGRYPDLSLPAEQMPPPDRNSDGWFHEETIQMYRLSLIISDCQKRDGEDLSVNEVQSLKQRLTNWFHFFTPHETLYSKQVLFTYLDISLTLGIRGLFQLINPPVITDVTPPALPLDLSSLLANSRTFLDSLETVEKSNELFIPWWLNLSLLFTVSVSCITVLHAGLKLQQAQSLLRQSFSIWNSLVSLHTKNPPEMAKECLWCLKMLNHMSCLRLQTSMQNLRQIFGIDHGDSSLNKNRFSQFGKAGDNEEDNDVELGQEDAHIKDVSVSATTSSPMLNPPTFETLLQDDDLFANLQWFDQWVDNYSLQQ